MTSLLDPVGFIADSIAICNALGIQTPAQRSESNKLMNEIAKMQGATESLRKLILDAEARIRNTVTTAAVIEMRSRLPKNIEVDSDKLDTMLKLLFIIKTVSARVVFATVIRYSSCNEACTLGMAGRTEDSIEDLIESISKLSRSIRHTNCEMTAFVGARCRGRQNEKAENLICAVLCCLVSDLFGFPSVSQVEDISTCILIPAGNKTIALLRGSSVERNKPDYDHLRRIFLVGDTRTGKSTLGNALSSTASFKVSKGMTGTLHIDHQDVVQEIDDATWLTEIYDTPGLNDKDGLDIFYQAAIEDKIVALQMASALILTMDVGSGLTRSSQNAVKAYKNLFGKNMVDMLLLVLTINESADKTKCERLVDRNWPTVVGMIDGIHKQNVVCISLHDLRGNEGSYSHVVVERLLRCCRKMPMKAILPLAEKLRKIKEDLCERKGKEEEKVKIITDHGWTAYEHLTSEFEEAPYSCVASLAFKGFVFKRTGVVRRLATVSTAGLLNVIRKTAIHVSFKDEVGKKVWKEFNSDGDVIFSSKAMRRFGDMLEENNLAVFVKRGDSTRVGTLRVHRHYITVIDPQQLVALKMEDVIGALQLEEKELNPEAFQSLKSIVFKKSRKTMQHRPSRLNQSSSAEPVHLEQGPREKGWMESMMAYFF